MGGLFSTPTTNEEKQKKWESMYWKLRLAHRSVPELTAEQVLQLGAERRLWAMPPSPAAGPASPTAATATEASKPEEKSGEGGAGEEAGSSSAAGATAGAGGAGAGGAGTTGAAEEETQPPLLFVDCRKDEEIAVSTIPGAMPRGRFDEMVEAGRVPEPATIVCYCTIGYRSGVYAKGVMGKLKPSQPMYNLKGSLLAWTHAHGPLVSPDGEPTKRVHVYAKSWSLASNDYEAVF